MQPESEDKDELRPYQGRWVARLDGRVVGQGETAEGARKAAQLQRHKERPRISYVPLRLSNMSPQLLQTIEAAAGNHKIYLVGGAVRDAILGVESHDFDFAVDRDAIGLARDVAEELHAAFYVLDRKSETARVLLDRQTGIRDVLDFSSFRGANIADDLKGRDFTINAMAYEPRGQSLVDPLHGAADLGAKLVRACGPTSVQDDPVRVLRAIRMAAALDFKLEAKTRSDVKEAAALLPHISAERQRDELFRILGGPRATSAVRALEMLGVLEHLVPELCLLKGLERPAPHVHNGWEHTLGVLRALDEILDVLCNDDRIASKEGFFVGLLSQRLGRYRPQFAEHFSRGPHLERSLRSLLFFAALLHDVAKPTTRVVYEDRSIHFPGHENAGALVAAERARFFNLGNDEIKWLRTVIAHHGSFFDLGRRTEETGELPTRQAIYHYFRDAAGCGPDLIVLGLADLKGARDHRLTERAWTAYIETARALLENYWEKPGEAVSPPQLIDGNDVMELLAAKEGPLVGALLRDIREAQAIGVIKTREEAIAFGRDWLGARMADQAKMDSEASDAKGNTQKPG
jgi:tRNA nucleotidyltransferase/poly(A) polymerase